MSPYDQINFTQNFWAQFIKYNKDTKNVLGIFEMTC